MERVLEVYQRPEDPKRPVVANDAVAQFIENEYKHCGGFCFPKRLAAGRGAGNLGSKYLLDAIYRG